MAQPYNQDNQLYPSKPQKKPEEKIEKRSINSSVFGLLLLVIYLFRDPLTKVVGPEAGIFLVIVLTIGALNWMSLARLVRANFLSRASRSLLRRPALGIPRGW